jgi:hypothetical protein
MRLGQPLGGSCYGPDHHYDNQDGAIIVAIIAILTTIGIGHLWNLVILVYHQMRVHKSPTDGLYRQQQVLMRALPPPDAMLSDRLKLSLT